MNLNSWDYYDLEQEMIGKNLYELQQIYIEQHKIYNQECSALMKVLSVEEEKEKQMKICEFHDGCMIKIALRITNMLTGIK